MIGRCGAWEILAAPEELWIVTLNEIAQVDHAAFVEERERVRPSLNVFDYIHAQSNGSKPNLISYRSFGKV